MFWHFPGYLKIGKKNYKKKPTIFYINSMLEFAHFYNLFMSIINMSTVKQP